MPQPDRAEQLANATAALKRNGYSNLVPKPVAHTGVVAVKTSPWHHVVCNLSPADYHATHKHVLLVCRATGKPPYNYEVLMFPNSHVHDPRYPYSSPRPSFGGTI